MRKVIALLAAMAVLGGCGVQRAGVAAKAKTQMVGMTKERVLACMGPPTSRAAEGATEVWSYASGGEAVGRVISAGPGAAIARTRFRSCTVNVLMINGAVSRLSYQGDTGGLLTQGEQCAYVLDACVQ